MSFDNGEKERILRKLLETERNEFRVEAEALASELRAKDAEIALLQGNFQRQTVRHLKAIEGLDAEIARLKGEVKVLEGALELAQSNVLIECDRFDEVGMQSFVEQARKELEGGDV